jgi:uracil-DNA glycosylase
MPIHPAALVSLRALCRERVFPSVSSGSLFNPYADETEAFDIKGAAAIRRQNLGNYFGAFQDVPPILIVGEAPGPRGCRFTGVPFTSERLFARESLPFMGRKTSAQVECFSEPTATIFWRVLGAHFPNFLCWNAVPFHPHLPEQPLSIRPPSAREVRAHLELLDDVLMIMKPQRILAVGRIAQYALNLLIREFVPIRHPSHGGAVEFERGVRETLFAQLAVDS